jgi:EthD domain
MPFKLVYLARRNPALTPEAFPEAWKSHSRLASQFSSTLGTHYSRVIQCLKAYQVQVPEGFLNDIDGVAMLTMKSWEDLQATRSDANVNSVLRDDEPRVFADYVDRSMLAVDESVLMDKGPGRYALLSFLPVNAHSNQSELYKVWSGAHAEELMDACHVAVGYHQCRVVDHPGVPYAFGGLAELWTSTLDDALSIAYSPGYAKAMAGLRRVADLPNALSMVVQISFEKRMGQETLS